MQRTLTSVGVTLSKMPSVVIVMAAPTWPVALPTCCMQFISRGFHVRKCRGTARRTWREHARRADPFFRRDARHVCHLPSRRSRRVRIPIQHASHFRHAERSTCQYGRKIPRDRRARGHLVDRAALLVHDTCVCITRQLTPAKRALNPDEWRSFVLAEKTQISKTTALYVGASCSLSHRYRFALEHNAQLGLPIGQHISVRALISGRQIMRSYTPVSRPDAKGHFDLLVKVRAQTCSADASPTKKATFRAYLLSSGWAIRSR